MSSHPARDDDENADARRHVAEGIATRLGRSGVHLSGNESGEELVQILEAVERFERAVQLAGGDLMVDEPIHGTAPTAPDNRAFVLPRRHGNESPELYVGRIDEGAARASAAGRTS